MKCTESRELRVLSMNQLNAKLSELYKELPPRKRAFQRKYRQHILNLINQIKHEQTMRRKSIKDTRNMDRNTQTIIMDTITKELFDNYLKLQRSGIMNMTDIEQGARILRCTQDEYETILWNYTALKNKFYPKSK